ncbi:hypothetical protein E1A91_A05G034700v1 [Gossypium mustelinum]|uniref:Uncharacterized protein n=1 Tax=Gossypium mustelinum TaxID=34275 RepID=A0A5D2Z1W4_GOSMU|nr:hypothetical protein E1A91_A05G034700v1 [Gossypium mustelinum]
MYGLKILHLHGLMEKFLKSVVKKFMSTQQMEKLLWQISQRYFQKILRHLPEVSMT